jgi:hypothetical protein
VLDCPLASGHTSQPWLGLRPERALRTTASHAASGTPIGTSVCVGHRLAGRLIGDRDRQLWRAERRGVGLRERRFDGVLFEDRHLGRRRWKADGCQQTLELIARSASSDRFVGLPHTDDE